MELRLKRYKQNKFGTQSANIRKHTLEECLNRIMNANMLTNDMQLKYTWQGRHGKRNHANRHHEQLIIAHAKCNKTLLVQDLVKITKTGQKLLFLCCINRRKTICKSAAT